MSDNSSSVHRMSHLDQKGYALLMVTVLTWSLFSFALGYVEVITNQKRQITSAENELRAEALAEAAMDETLWEYNYGGGDFDAASGWTISGTTATKTVSSFTNTSGAAVGSYTITVTNYNTDNPKVSVNGTYATAQLTNNQGIKALLSPRPIFDAGIKSVGAISLSGHFATDSFDSADGAYGGSNVGANGNIFSNGLVSGSISVSGSAYVDGSASTAGGSISGTGISGSSLTTADPFVPYLPTIPASLALLAPSGNITNNTSLSAGLYQYGKIDLASSKHLDISGDVTILLTSTQGIDLNGADININTGGSLTIYMSGAISISGNANVNYTGTAQNSGNLIIHNYGTQSLTLNGTAQMAGLINSPLSSATVNGDFELYGAMITNTYSGSGNAVIHYDENGSTTVTSDGKKMGWMIRS